ncbi:MAG: hypothetical protein K6T73_10455 [Candidatus Bathyarchaeota archaeon]|nr:hypothetical protein [Candidatus Bathyarchaeota archaeon]
MEYPLDWRDVERKKKYYEDRGKNVELVWMTPAEFLSKVPHISTPLVSSLFDLREEFFSKTSLGYIRKAFLSKMKMEPLLLDYTALVDGWPSHEGRHRAYIAKTYNIEKIPVLVVTSP